MKITADSVRINGPKVDGGFTITFNVGEYEQDKVAELLTIPQQTMIQLDIVYGENKKH